MELPKYAVPKSLLSPPPAPSSRGDHSQRGSLNEIDDPGYHSKTTGKRRRISARSSSQKPILGRTGLPQYTVPESLLSPQSIHSSLADLALQAPPNEHNDLNHHNIPTPISHPESSIGVHSRPETVCLTLDTQHEAQNNSPLLTPIHTNQSDDLLRTRPHSYQSLDESPDFAFQTMTKDLGMKHDCFLGMSHKSFIPTPDMIEPWDEAPISNLSWNSGTKLPFLLDEAMPEAEQDETAPERYELGSDKGEYQLDTSASTEARLSHVLKAVAAAGFDSLDNAVVTYYTKALKDDEWPGQEQRLNRIRRLPVLLKELHLASQGWGQWQRRSFQEQVIRSTEDILIAELEDHLAARRPDRHNSTCGTEQSGQACKHKTRDQVDIEAELPNTWTLLTSLSTKYDTVASRHGQSDVPNLVGKFLAAGTDLGT